MLKWLKKVHLEERISEIYILVLRVNGIENHGKKIDELKNIDQNYYCSNYYDVNVNKYKVKWETSLRLLKNERWINYINSDGWF